jgi:hypothetical protein
MIGLDLLVIGPGGGGQTYFMKFIENELKINKIHDSDGLKHLSHPNKIPNNYKIKKCIFLFNDPLKSIISHFRRNFVKRQIVKMENKYNLDDDDLKNLDTFLMKVEETNTDLFCIIDQFNNWLNAELDCPIYFLDFNNILNEKDRLSDFLSIDKTHFDKFEIKIRNADYSNFKFQKSVKLYENMYKHMIKNVSLL